MDGGPDDCEKDEFVEYALKIEAHEKCKNYDITEAIEVNFYGALDDLKVEAKDSARYIKGDQKEPNKSLLVISQLYELNQRKYRSFSRCPFRAEFQNVLNFFPSYKIVQDITETVNCLQIIIQT